MKVLFISFTLSFITLLTNAQSYIPLPLDSAVWQVWSWASAEFCSTNVNHGAFYFYKTNGDTIIKSLKYTKIVVEQVDSNSCGPFDVIGVIRQDTLARKIYIIKQNDTTETILYDFSQNIGDTINSTLLGEGGGAVITGIDSVLINGIYHRQLLIGSDFRFIEGIGSSTGLLGLLFNFEWGMTLNCVAHNSKIIYPDSFNTFGCKIDLLVNINEPPLYSIFEILSYPNPTNGSFIIKISKPINAIDIFNLVGEKVFSDQTNNLKSSSDFKREIRINLYEIPNGMYFIKIWIEKGNEILYKKLIILK